ncbi:MAG: dipeptidase [Candidatus Dormibacteria bacterium]
MEQILVIDGHNDLPWAHRLSAGYDLERLELDRDQPSLRTDLPRLRRGGVGGQFWSVYVPATLEGAEAVLATLEQVEFVQRLAQRYPHDLALARTAAEAEAAMDRGQIACFMGAEGGHCIASSLPVLRILRRLGVLYLTLTHNRNVGWAGSCTDSPAMGLSAFGESVVLEMNRLGMLVDLSHVSVETARDALRVTRAPAIFSHSSCRALCSHPRDVPDEVLGLLPQNQGVIMLTFVPAFISQEFADWREEALDARGRRGLSEEGPDLQDFLKKWERDHPRPEATVEQAADHVDHAREVCGVEHVGLGGDFDGTVFSSRGLEDVSCYPNLLQVLRGRGWSEEDLQRLARKNVLRVLRQAEAVAQEQT